jgi:hypothetical protein
MNGRHAVRVGACRLSWHAAGNDDAMTATRVLHRAFTAAATVTGFVWPWLIAQIRASLSPTHPARFMSPARNTMLSMQQRNCAWARNG